MKLQHQQSSMQQQISGDEDEYLTQVALKRSLMKNKPNIRAYFIGDHLVFAPNPPTPEAIQRAKFVDKTYQWHGR